MANERYFIYGTRTCPYCSLATEALDSLNKEYVFFNLSDDNQFLNYTKQFYDHPTVPIIIRNDKNTGQCSLIGGFSDLSNIIKVNK
jgi:glutaredoxin